MLQHPTSLCIFRISIPPTPQLSLLQCLGQGGEGWGLGALGRGGTKVCEQVPSLAGQAVLLTLPGDL